MTLLISGLILLLLPTHVTKILSKVCITNISTLSQFIFQLADQCDIVEDERDFLLSVLSSTVLKELGIVWL